MSPEKAVVEAAKTSQLKWLGNLLDYYDHKVLSTAIVTAAKDGHSEAMGIFVLELIGAQTGPLNKNTMKILEALAVAAAGTGHLVVVEKLLLEIEAEREDIHADSDNGSDSDESSPSDDDGPCTTAWNVLDEATANGNLDIVKFAAELAKQPEHGVSAFQWSQALGLAISGRDFDIVSFLLDPGRHAWDYMKTIEQAIDEEQHEIADLIYQSVGDQPFLKVLAREGKLNAIAYLYNGRHNEPDSVHNAFVKAAKHGHTDIVAFLLCSGPISTEAFDEAFERAAFSDKLQTVRFLYDQHRVSRASINAVFKSTKYAAILICFYKQYYPVEAMIEAFKNASRYNPGKGQLRMLWLLKDAFQEWQSSVGLLFELSRNLTG